MLKLFDPFVLLFTAGFTFTGIWFLFKLIRWIEKLSEEDRYLFRSNLFTAKTWQALGEVIRESLLHRRIFGRNIRLGYMHMSLAFGWFILIVLGNIESTYYSGELFKPIYVSVFWRFFDPGPPFPEAVYQPGFAFWMDFFLLMVLSGLLLALVKRVRSAFLGMKRTTRQRPFDRIAITALWLIFPMRLLAESFTCGANGTGSFLTGSLGHLFAMVIDPARLVLPAWWGYSFVLSAFFFMLPFTRYAHIPSEAVLIFLRKYGVRVKKESPGFIDLSVHSCSACGICIDPCQLSAATPGSPVQSSYFMKSVRHREPGNVQWDCLLCGRCEKACPVGIEVVPLRQLNRLETGIGTKPNLYGHSGRNGSSSRILYFAGCMTHLTPSIIASMKRIFEESGVSWQFFDSDGRACCGRPLKLAGQAQAAEKIRNALEADILASESTLLVTSCPICYRMFKEDYDLPGIRILHHTEYILELIDWQRIKVRKEALSATYHEPCELGRGTGLVKEPRKLVSHLFESDVTPEIEGLCCGGSLGGPGLDLATRRTIARSAAEELFVNQPDVMVTACPMCKKSFTPVSTLPVMDFAEITAKAIIPTSSRPHVLTSSRPHVLTSSRPHVLTSSRPHVYNLTIRCLNLVSGVVISIR